MSGAPGWLHPLAVLTSGVAAWGALALGAPAALAIAAPALGAAALAVALERRYPFDRAWSEDQGDTRADVALALVGLVVAQVVLWGAGLMGLRWLGESSAWPDGWPLAAQVVGYLGVVELLGYWSHRAMHRVGALWPWHRVHHAATRLYWLNSFRLHPADAALSTLVSLAWAAALGAPERVVAIGAACSTAHLWLQHSNARLGTLGWAPWLATSEFHRWHHVPDADAAQVNYGHLTGVWDWCFGTWRRGAPEAPLEVGVRADDAAR